MQKKKILYLIYSSHPKSGGGHFHSLLTIIKNLSPSIDYKILNLGVVHADTLKKNIESDYIDISKVSFFNKIGEVYKYVKSYNPDVIHAFDSSSLTVIRSVNFLLKLPIVYSKCGGVNGGKFIQDADAYVCFSQENAIHYEKFKKNDVPISLLPNRATRITDDKKRIEELKEIYKLNDKTVVLRISRFHELHERSIMQSIALLKSLYVENRQVHLLLIGIPQSKECIERIKVASQNYPISIITDPMFTNNASELLSVADIVVATGRGVMEAASIGKVIFCPVNQGDLPAPLNSETLPLMLKYNFSQRTQGITSDENSILKFLRENQNLNKNFILGVFDKYFNIETVIPNYQSIYQKVFLNKHGFRYHLNYFEDLIRYLKPNFISKRFFSGEINK